MASKREQLLASLREIFAERALSITDALREVTMVVAARDLTEVMTALRDRSEFRFDQLTDVCGVDYGSYGQAGWTGGASPDVAAQTLLDAPEQAPNEAGQSRSKRFAAVYHLLSYVHNWRLRVRAYADDNEFPVVDSVVGVWPSANWFEREAFDLFGIMFTGHPDLRRILTDYGFVGHPFRKDFPIYGNVEMRYDPEQQRVIYQPVTIEPREIVPRIVREPNYADSKGKG